MTIRFVFVKGFTLLPRDPTQASAWLHRWQPETSDDWDDRSPTAGRSQDRRASYGAPARPAYHEARGLPETWTGRQAASEPSAQRWGHDQQQQDDGGGYGFRAGGPPKGPSRGPPSGPPPAGFRPRPPQPPPPQPQALVPIAGAAYGVYGGPIFGALPLGGQMGFMSLPMGPGLMVPPLRGRGRGPPGGRGRMSW
jgi:hypothetical protein